MSKMRPTHDTQPHRYDGELGRYVPLPRIPEDVRLRNCIRLAEHQAHLYREEAAKQIRMAEDNEQQAQIFRDALVKWQTDAAYERQYVDGVGVPG